MTESISNGTEYAYLVDHFGIKVVLFFKNDSTRIFPFVDCTKIASGWLC